MKLFSLISHILPVSAILLQLPIARGAASVPQDPFCRDQLKPLLRELKSFDAHAIAKQIDSQKLRLKQIASQGVSRVLGLPRGKSYLVRLEAYADVDVAYSIRHHGFDLKTRPQREVATRVLDRLLGFNLVPEVRLTQIGGKTASIQVRVDGEEFMSAAHYQPYITQKIRSNPEAILRHKSELERMAILDMVSGNLDRNITNFIYDETHNRIWAIDHADSFPVVEKHPGGQWFWTLWSTDLEKPMEALSREKILSLDADFLAEKLRAENLLEEEALTQMKRRIQLLISEVKAHPDASMKEIGEKMERHTMRFGGKGSSP